MRARNNPNAKNELLACHRFITTTEELQKKIAEKAKNKICIEVGMGKGEFITQMAFLNPDVLYIGIEVSMSILALAIKKITKFEEENNIVLDNLYLMSFDALHIAEVFHPNQIEKIYLNFSDPWPKKKHTKRRLTHENFLKEYEKILVPNGVIEFKTDNRGLFEYSLISMQNFGFTFLEVYLDLHQTDIPNIMTEYEKKFSSLGPIYKLVAKLKV